MWSCFGNIYQARCFKLFVSIISQRFLNNIFFFIFVQSYLQNCVSAMFCLNNLIEAVQLLRIPVSICKKVHRVSKKNNLMNSFCQNSKQNIYRKHSLSFRYYEKLESFQNSKVLSEERVAPKKLPFSTFSGQFDDGTTTSFFKCQLHMSS